MRLIFSGLALLASTSDAAKNKNRVRGGCNDLTKVDVASDLQSDAANYSLNRKNQKTMVLTCNRDRKNWSTADKTARKEWKKDLRKSSKVVYKCINNSWSAPGNNRAPRCPSGATGSWASFKCHFTCANGTPVSGGEWGVCSSKCQACESGFNLGDEVCVEDLIPESNLPLILDGKPATIWETGCARYYETGRRLTKPEAKTFCEDHGLKLAQQRNEEEYAALNDQGTFWLDATRSTSDAHQWVWGSPSSDTDVDCLFWNPGEPNGVHSEPCLHANHGGSGRAWNDRGCSGTDNVICELRSCVPSCDHLRVNGREVQGVESECVTYYPTDKRMGRDAAKDFCEAHGLKLATQKNEVEHELMVGRSSFWLDGIRSESDKHQWVWGEPNSAVDINRVGCYFWKSGQPDHYGDNENCMHVLSNGLWNDIPCNYNYHVTCEQRKCEGVCEQTAELDIDAFVAENDGVFGVGQHRAEIAGYTQMGMDDVNNYLPVLEKFYETQGGIPALMTFKTNWCLFCYPNSDRYFGIKNSQYEPRPGNINDNWIIPTYEGSSTHHCNAVNYEIGRKVIFCAHTTTNVRTCFQSDAAGDLFEDAGIVHGISTHCNRSDLSSMAIFVKNDAKEQLDAQ